MPLNQQFRIALAPLLLLLADCGGGGGGESMPAPPSAPTISVQPTDQNVPLGQAATFSVTAMGSAPLSYQWNKNSMPIAGATASSYTTPDTQAGDNGSTFQVVVSNKVGSTPSVSAKLSVSSGPPPAGIDVTTYKYDLNRSGLNPAESALTVANVASATFGLLRTLSVDGRVDAQPLYLSQLKLAGAAHNVVFAATEHDSVYAFDADSGAVLWHVSLLGAGESTSGSAGLRANHPRNRRHLDAGDRSQRRRQRRNLPGRNVHRFQAGLSSAPARARCHHRRRASGRTDGDFRIVSDLRRVKQLQSRATCGTGGAAAVERNDLYQLHFALRRPAILRLDHRVYAELARHQRRPQCRGKQQCGTRHLDERRRTRAPTPPATSIC